MSAVAEEADVTRLTLYRHFPNRDELFAACMGHWRALHPPPDPDSWRRIPAFDSRVRRALQELYEWYQDNGDDLFPIYRDAAHTPESNQAGRAANNERMVDALIGGTGVRGAARLRLRAAAGHLIGFWSWRSLVVDQGLATDEAVDLAVLALIAVRRAEEPPPSH